MIKWVWSKVIKNRFQGGLHSSGDEIAGAIGFSYFPYIFPLNDLRRGSTHHESGRAIVLRLSSMDMH